MKTGKTLTELAAELERQQTAKKDFVADTRATEVESIAIEKGPATTTITVADQDFTVGEHAHDQIAARLKIPKKYYDRMREENFDLASAVLPVLSDLGQGAMRVESAEITSSRFYLKAIFPRVENEVAVGDPVQSGILISNSEIGVGALQISPLIFRLVCKNGLIAADSSMKRYHVGRAGGSEEEAYELFSDKTLKADDAAIFGKVQDLVRAAITGESFAKIVEKMKESTRRGIEGNPVKAVEVLANRLGFSEAEAGGILKHLTGGGSLTQYGLLNAVTRYAQDVASYDRSTELEAAGGLVLELKPSEWQEIAKAA